MHKMNEYRNKYYNAPIGTFEHDLAQEINIVMTPPSEYDVCEAIATFFNNKKGKIYFSETAADKTYDGKYEWYFWYNGTMKKNGQTYREIKVLRKNFESYPTYLISLIGRFIEARENVTKLK